MKKLYTKAGDTYVMQDPGDLSLLNLNSCAVARKSGQLYVCPLETLNGKETETKSDSWKDPVFEFYGSGEKPEKFMILGGKRSDMKFCSLCRDRLNGLTANCFDHTVKPKGCTFEPIKPLDDFQISLNGWQKVPSYQVNSRSAFRKPYSPGDISFDQKIMSRNKKALHVKADFGTCLERKKTNECAHCIYKGLCRINSMKIAERCLVTQEKTVQKCLGKITRKFGSTDQFLNLLSYSGKEMSYRAPNEKRKTKWLILAPSSPDKFTVRKAWRPWKMIQVKRTKIESELCKGPVIQENKNFIASLAWFFLEKYWNRRREAYRGYRGRTIRILSVCPAREGIEATYYPYGWRLSLRTATLTSFNDILRLEL